MTELLRLINSLLESFFGFLTPFIAGYYFLIIFLVGIALVGTVMFYLAKMVSGR